MAGVVGRDAQIGMLDALLDHAADRHGAALVLRGEAGIGKSVLLAQAIKSGQARGMRVLTVTGVQAEGQIPYAGLDQLLRPLHPAFGSAGSPYGKAFEVLDFVGGLDEPVLMAVEDAHWLDVATWETLAFLSRRLESDRIAVLMAVRDGEDIDRRLAAAGLPELRLEPLSLSDAGKLLDDAAPGLTPALRARVLQESAGNPLGVVELGAVAARSGGSALLPVSLPLSTRVERTFGGLVAELPPPTRDLLLVAALDDTGNFDEILAAAALLTGAEVPAEAIQPAVTARLVSVDENYELRFRHPLLRSALNQRAGPGERRRVHAALAEVLSESPERRLWHRAAAAKGPDEKLARELTEAAARASQRQAVAPAFAAMSRAVQLSEDPAERGRRQLLACDLAHEQGDSETVLRILSDIDESALTAADRARLTWRREAYFQNSSSSEPDRLLLYAELIDTMRRDGEPGLAVDALSQNALRVYYAAVPPLVRDRFTEVTLALGLAADDPVRTQILLLIDPVTHGAEGLDHLRRFAYGIDVPATMRAELSMAASAVGALQISHNLALSSAADLRRQGRMGALAQALACAASAYAQLGDPRAALPLSVECMALAEETGQPTWVLGSGMVAGLAEALSGDVASARRRAYHAEQILYAARRLPMLAFVQRIRGVAALAEGHAEDAFRQLLRVFDPADGAYFPHFHLLLLGPLAEAAALGGFLDELRPVVTALEPIAARSQSPSLRVGLGYARAVLTGDYETALADDLTDWPFDKARLQLTYGSALRRAYRITDSRPLLRAAADTFDALGATPWADRARAELRATGETRRKPIDALAALTPQEQQIARLAAEGLSNREIGERLFLSPRTVSTHLYRIYPKVNVGSRAELARVITSSDVV